MTLTEDQINALIEQVSMLTKFTRTMTDDELMATIKEYAGMTVAEAVAKFVTAITSKAA